MIASVFPSAPCKDPFEWHRPRRETASFTVSARPRLKRACIAAAHFCFIVFSDARSTRQTATQTGAHTGIADARRKATHRNGRRPSVATHRRLRARTRVLAPHPAATQPESPVAILVKCPKKPTTDPRPGSPRTAPTSNARGCQACRYSPLMRLLRHQPSCSQQV